MHFLFAGTERFRLPDKVIPIQPVVIKLKLDLGYRVITLLEIQILESETNSFFELLERTELVLQNGIGLEGKSLGRNINLQVDNVINILSENRTL